MFHLPANILVRFSNNMSYAGKAIDMWDQVCERHGPHTPNALPVNLCLIFALSQESSQDTTRYIGMIRNIIYCFKYGGQYFSTLLMNLIAIPNLDPTRHQSVMDVY